jgi:hypothetical protein
MSKGVPGLLALILLAWIGLSVTRPALHDEPALPAITAFEGATQLPAAEIVDVLQHARTRMFSLNRQGRYFAIGGEIGSWVAFVCTGCITVILGWYRRPPRADAQLDLAGLSRRVARTIGVLAALGAVLTAGSSLAVNHAHQRYKQADTARKLLLEAQRAVADAKTADEARDVLGHLQLEIGRL